MGQQHNWCIVGPRGKHKAGPAQKLQKTPPVKPFNHLAPSLAALPAEVTACIYRNLHQSPAAAVNLAQAGRSLASEFSAHRCNIIRQCISGVCPVYSTSLGGSFTDIHLKIWWPQETAIRRLYALSRERGAIEAMWAATFTQLLSSLRLQGYGSVPQGSYTLAHRRYLSSHYTSVSCCIQLQSSTPLYVPAQWLRDAMMVRLASALSDVFGGGGNIRIHVTICRLCGPHEYFLLFDRFSCNADDLDCSTDVSDSWSVESYLLQDIELFEPEPVHLPLSQQVLAITGDWCDGQSGQIGEVHGDQVFDETKLDEDFVTWQSWDKDVWKYEPFSCEIAKEPRWHST